MMMYVLLSPRRRAGLGSTPQDPLSAGAVREMVETGLRRLSVYDRFLRDPTDMERRGNDNILTRWLVGEDALILEAAAFWKRLSAADRASYVRRWIALVEAGRALQRHAETRPPSERLPKSVLDSVSSWASQAQKFVGDIDRLRQEKRAEARLDPDWSFWDKLKLAAVLAVVGVAGVAWYARRVRGR